MVILMTDSNASALMTSRDVMKYLKVSRTTLWRLTRDGLLTSYRVGGDMRFKMSDVQNYLERHKSDSGDKASDAPHGDSDA